MERHRQAKKTTAAAPAPVSDQKVRALLERYVLYRNADNTRSKL
jgi:hypothetical protein